jgi:hypothetical protein
MIKLVCIKSLNTYDCGYEKGKLYDYYTNFGGLNHFVVDGNNNKMPFDGPLDGSSILNTDITTNLGDRLYVFDYFQRMEEYRDNKIDEVLN